MVLEMVANHSVGNDLEVRILHTAFIAMGFTCVAADCDREEAERLITQHVLGGGNIVDITNAFAEAVSESDFFQKMLGMTQDEQETPKKATKSKKVADEETEED